jgi:transcriptional regulator with XRE-family HTH domain
VGWYPTLIKKYIIAQWLSKEEYVVIFGISAYCCSVGEICGCIDIILERTEKRKMNLGENLKQARKRAGITQKELAERIGVYQKDISRWEANALTPGSNYLAKICKTLQVSADEILELGPWESNTMEEKITDTQNRRPVWVVKDVEAKEDYTLCLTFANGERKIYDAKPLLQIELYENLKNPAFFMQAHVECGTVVWNDDLDIAPEHLYECSTLI